MLAGKNILLSGTTGFLGKVVLSMLLRRYPQVGRVYTLIRPGISDKARERFNKGVATSPAMEPAETLPWRWFVGVLCPERWCPSTAMSSEHCGIGAQDLGRIEAEGGLDLILNSAGLVDFDPPVDQALGINALGIQNLVALSRHFDAALLHVSTCFVAGGQSRHRSPKDDPIIDRSPVPIA
ncbi:MAG: SDR family oxidoreductase [Myxococcota bacterium]